MCIHDFDLNPDEGEAIDAVGKQRNIKVMGRVLFDSAFIHAMVRGKTHRGVLCLKTQIPSTKLQINPPQAGKSQIFTLLNKS